MLTVNDLKQGTKVRLVSGFTATLEDNKKGNTRLAMVNGFCNEMGSIYAHDIAEALVNGVWQPVLHTPAQNKLRKTTRAMGF